MAVCTEQGNRKWGQTEMDRGVLEEKKETASGICVCLDWLRIGMGWWFNNGGWHSTIGAWCVTNGSWCIADSR